MLVAKNYNTTDVGISQERQDVGDSVLIRSISCGNLPREDMSTSSGTMFNPVSAVFEFVASYGWFLVGGAAFVLYALNKLRPTLNQWRQAREDAVYHKNPDLALARMEAIQRAREKQQEELLAASWRAQELQREREERKRQETLERLQKYGSGSKGQRLGESSDGDYLPLSGGVSTSSYRPPKRSKCGGGGCGR